MNAPPSPPVSLFSLLAIPLAAFSTRYGRSPFDATVFTTPHYNLLSSASALVASITFGFMWFSPSRLPTTTEILMGNVVIVSQTLMTNNLKPVPLQEDTQR